MVQDDPHPVPNKKGYENGYGHQGGRKEAVDTPASTQSQGYANGPSPTQVPSSQRQGGQPQSSMSKPVSTQAQGMIGSATIHHGPSPTQVPSSQRQGGQPQNSMSKPISTQAQGKIGSETIHHGPSPTQVPSSQGQGNQPQSFMSNPISSNQAQGEIGRENIHHGPSSTQLPSSQRQGGEPQSSMSKPISTPAQGIIGSATLPQVSSPEDGHNFEHNDWKSGANRVPKSVPSYALQDDHFNGDKEPNKLHMENEKSSASPPDKPRIQVNVNVYYDQDGNCRVDSNPQQPPPARPPPTSDPARHPPARPPPPKSNSSSCCSIL